MVPKNNTFHDLVNRLYIEAPIGDFDPDVTLSAGDFEKPQYYMVPALKKAGIPEEEHADIIQNVLNAVVNGIGKHLKAGKSNLKPKAFYETIIAPLIYKHVQEIILGMDEVEIDPDTGSLADPGVKLSKVIGWNARIIMNLALKLNLLSKTPKSGWIMDASEDEVEDALAGDEDVQDAVGKVVATMTSDEPEKPKKPSRLEDHVEYEFEGGHEDELNPLQLAMIDDYFDDGMTGKAFKDRLSNFGGQFKVMASDTPQVFLRLLNNIVEVGALIPFEDKKEVDPGYAEDEDEDGFETPDEYLSDIGADVPEMDPYSGDFFDSAKKDDAKLIFEKYIKSQHSN